MQLWNFSSGKVDLRQCHYLVDLDTEEETPLEPRYPANKEEWNIIAYKPFLQASRYSTKNEITKYIYFIISLMYLYFPVIFILLLTFYLLILFLKITQINFSKD